MSNAKPAVRPADPRFSPGPTRKRPGWSAEAIAARAALGRNHRTPAAVARIKRAIDLTRSVLEVPQSHQIAIIPGSDTGAVECAMWTMLGERGVDVFAWEAFGRDWVVDAVDELKFDDLRVFTAEYGELPDLAQAQPDRDVVFTWNGTTSGVRAPDMDWVSPAREGVTICDATSAAFAQRLDWDKLDVVTYSFQKVMGGEAAHGVIILSPRAIARLESYRPPRPVPKLFRIATDLKVNRKLFEGDTINTPSLWCIEDYIDALEWAEGLGGLDAMIARADANAAVVYDWLERSDWAQPLCADPKLRSNTSACFTFRDPRIQAMSADDRRALQGAVIARLEAEGAVFDIAAYRAAPPGWRLWCGGTVEAADLKAATQWLDWAYAEVMAERAPA